MGVQLIHHFVFNLFILRSPGAYSSSLCQAYFVMGYHVTHKIVHDSETAHCTLCSCMCALCVLGHITFTLSLLSHSKQETYEFLQLQPQRSQYL